MDAGAYATALKARIYTFKAVLMVIH